MRRAPLLLWAALLLPETARAAPTLKRPQAEHRIAPQRRAAALPEPARTGPATQLPEDGIEALHYFRDRPQLPAQTRPPEAEAQLEPLIAERERAAQVERARAIALLERFIAETEGHPSELADALLRLAELRWEDARSSSLRAYAAWQALPEAGRGRPPTPDYAPAFALYDRLLRDHPQFARLDLVLYMKGYGLLEQGDRALARAQFARILADFPQSRFRPDAHMALAEHAFATEHDPRAALAEYDRVLLYEQSELYDLALFKSAWCLWQLDRKDDAALRFRKVLDLDGVRAAGARRRHLRELQSEALEYLIQVFTEDEQNRAADVRRFLQEIGGERHVLRVLRRLSATYYDQARFDRGIEAYELLLELDPKHGEAPRYRLAIARGALARDDFPAALEAFGRLSRDYGPRSTWASQQPDSDLVEEAEQLAEQALREQALALHEQGQRDRDTRALERAVALYRLYLEAYPQTDEAYRLGFYLGEILFHRLARYPEAGEAYLAAAELRPQGEFTKDALYNAIGSFERVREQELARCAATEPCPESENDRRFGRAIELYASSFPNDPELPELLFRQGRLYYDRRVYDPAVRLFGELIERFPESRYASDAGELVLESFQRAADYQNIERWSRKLKRAPAFSSPAAQKRLDGLILASVFKLGEQLAQKGEHARAAAAYLGAAAEFPKDERAPKALYNAGLELARAGSIDGADRTYGELLSKYPGSAEGALAALSGAEMYESIAQFRDAARFYGTYASHFPRGEKSEAAAYNAVLLFSAAGAQRETVQAGRLYLERHPNGKESAAVTFLIGRAQEAQGQTREAKGTYQKFVARTSDPALRVEANLRLGELLRRGGDERAADAALAEAVEDGRRLKAGSGRYHAAHARFLQGDALLREFEQVKIGGDVATLPKRLQTKAKLLERAAGVYADVVEFGVAEWVTAALYKIGESYESFARALTEAPLPEGLSESEQQVYRDELARFVVPIEERALEAYEGGYRRARELSIYNRWTSAMREALTRLNEVAYPKLKEQGVALSSGSQLQQPKVLVGLRRSGGEKP